MASRPLLTPHKVIENGVMTGTTVLTSSVTVIQNISYIGYSVSFTGTPTGTFSVEVSNDYSINPDGSVRNAGTWTPITLTGSPVASGSAGTGFIDIDGIAAYAIRLKYTNTSGSGVLNAYVNGKVS